VYVSDKPGEHDAALLRRLVCSDGSVLRADGPGLPTAKTLCSDPTRERVPLEIWNRSGRAGLIGVFHALYANGRAEPVSGVVRALDVPGLAGERFACYAVQAGQLSELDRTASRSFSLAEQQFEIFWLVPIEQGFAALGLADKLNGPAALRAVEWLGPDTCRIALADGGELLAWSERAPRSVQTGGKELAFRYEPQTRAVRVAISPTEAPDVTLRW
jgi:hypothetical protein